MSNLKHSVVDHLSGNPLQGLHKCFGREFYNESPFLTQMCILTRRGETKGDPAHRSPWGLNPGFPCASPALNRLHR